MRGHIADPAKWQSGCRENKTRYIFNPYNPADGTADKDGDGYTNLEEYLSFNRDGPYFILSFNRDGPYFMTSSRIIPKIQACPEQNE